MEISVLFEEGLKGELPAPEWLTKVVEKALEIEGASSSSEVSILIAGQERVHQLNREYLDEDRPTDVLSFPMLTPDDRGFVAPPDGVSHLGEIVISLPQATEQAKEHCHSAQREIAILAIHGALHLLGYDHAGSDEELEMKRRENVILGSLDIE